MVILLAIVCLLPKSVYKPKPPQKMEIGPDARKEESTQAGDEMMRKYLDDKAAWEIPDFAGCDGPSAAMVAEHYIKARLKAPASADFSGYDPRNFSFTQNRYIYTGYVDSQNGFGAMIRMNFRLVMECRSGGLIVVDVQTSE